MNLLASGVAANGMNWAAEWSELFRRVWAQGTAHTLELARAVGATNSQFRHFQWQQVWKALPFSRRKADRLAVIGRRSEWVKWQMLADLPVGWSILYELAQLERGTFEELVVQSPQATRSARLLWTYTGQGNSKP